MKKDLGIWGVDAMAKSESVLQNILNHPPPHKLSDSKTCLCLQIYEAVVDVLCPHQAQFCISGRLYCKITKPWWPADVTDHELQRPWYGSTRFGTFVACHSPSVSPLNPVLSLLSNR